MKDVDSEKLLANLDLILVPMLYESTADAVCECVSAAADLIQVANPHSVEEMKARSPHELRWSLAHGFARLAYTLIRAECDACCACRRVLRACKKITW